jgi:L-alanine-DL-glutamate epimerase-like enolase superfamily enzyme
MYAPAAMSFRLISIEVVPLSVPLLEPFVIASGRVDATRAALVRATLADAQSGVRVRGLGEAAALPPVTCEDQPELLDAIAAAATSLAGVRLGELDDLKRALDASLGHSKVARAGVESALLDAWARLLRIPLCVLLSGERPRALLTDITLPIAEPKHSAQLALGYRARGFQRFKVKVGKDLDGDVRVLLAVHERVPDAVFRLDANAGFDAEQALSLVRAARARSLHIECFEQPCAAEDWDGMAEVTREAGVPVVADESVQDLADLATLVERGAGNGVNLKLAKSGGLLAALELGRAAQRHGLRVMCGGMVETRLGMTAMAHVACALGGVDYVDLDTAFLLAEERFDGGYVAQGPVLDVGGGAGLGVSERR